MTEVSTRGGGLPRAGPQRARGRGRGPFNNSSTAPQFGSSSIAIEYKLNGHRSHSSRFSDLHSSSPDEPEELKSIRKKHGQKLSTIKELFPTWTDEDLLMALNEAAGDLELAAARISEGLTEQWGSVKTKKDKKTGGAQQAPSGRASHGTGLGNGLDGRVGRGRGDIPRGSSRAGGRGAAPRGTGRGQWATGSARPSHALPSTEDSFVPTTTPSAWSLGPPASVLLNGHAANVTVPEPSATLATIPAESSQSPDLAQAGQATAGASDSKLDDGNAIQESPNRPVDHSKWTPEPPKKPISRVIAPGTKMSWAQIARPADPPKPPPAATISQQPPPVTASRPAASDVQSVGGAPIASSEPLETVATPEVAPTDRLPDNQVTINIPDPAADVWHTEPVPAIDDIKPSLATAGPNVWNDDPVLQPLGVGEGWAETVLAQPSESKTSIFDNQTATNLILTPSEAGNIGPIELAAPSTASALEPTAASATPPEVNAQELNLPVAEPPSIRINNQPTPPSNNSILAPPGLTKRTSTRKGQEAAVVMPGSGTPNLDRMGLTFGSLRLYGEAIETNDASQAPPLDVPSPPLPTIEEPAAKEPSTKLEERPIDKSATPPQLPAEPAKSPSPPVPPPVMEEKVPFAAPTVNVNYNSTQSHPSAQPSPPQLNHQSSQAVPHVHQPPPPNTQAAPPHTSAAPPQSSSFGTRYPSGNQYVAPEPSTVHQQGSISQAPQPQQPDAFSHYPAFRQDPMAVYFQQQQQQQQQQSAVAQHSSSPAPASQTPATYGSFNHMNQQVPQPSQQPAQAGFGQAPQSAPEYAALYGQEALRSLQQGYYDSYAHAQVAQSTFQSRSPHGGDETAKSAIVTQLAAQGQPQQVAQHQHQHQHQHQQPQQPQQQQPAGASASGASQQYPGMQPSPMPYPYYPYYQQYGQLPPNYQNPSYPYGLQGPSPYYSVQGSQQYPVAGGRAGQSQYPMQGGPGNSGTSGGGAVPNAHAHQQQHGAQHGLVVANNGGFRQVSQPGVGGSQIGGAQVAGQGVGGGNGIVPGSGSGMGVGQQAGMHQQQHYYGSGYYDPQAAGQQGPPQQSVSGGGAHHHHHHHSQQAQRQAGAHHHGHHHAQNQGGQQQQNVGGGAAGGGGPGGQGGQGNGGDRKDPFTFSSDRFFNQ